MPQTLIAPMKLPLSLVSIAVSLINLIHTLGAYRVMFHKFTPAIALESHKTLIIIDFHT